jgi:hypothetical protein
VKKKRLLAVLGCILALAIATGLAVPLASASPVTFLNPFGDVEQPAEGALAPRLGSLDGKRVLMLWYGTAADANLYTVRALEGKLQALYPDVTFAEGNGTDAAMLGARTLYGPKSASTYAEWAGYDAVVIAVVDDNVGAYWVSRHAREIEARGTPVAVVANELSAAAVLNGALKNGFAGIQIAEISSAQNSRAYSQSPTAGASGVSPRQTFIADNVLTGAAVGGVVAALTGGAPAARMPIAPVRNISLTFDLPADPGAANQFFLDKSMADGFGDGLALLIPTADLVDSLLASVDRDKGDILGKMLGGGIITVEKVAINAAMAGVIPKAFPIVLAAMEAFAQDREKQNMFDYALRTGDTQLSVLMMVSGPLSEELGMRSDRSDLGSGPWGALNDANATIGRAVKLCFRNIGRNAPGDLAYRGAFKRFNDHALLVCTETLPSLPNAGWPPHSEFIGLGTAATNTVTLIGVNMTRVQGSTPSGGAAGSWSMGTIISSARTAVAATAATADIASIVTYPAYMADFLVAQDIGAISVTNLPSNWNELNGGYGLTTKAAVQRALVGSSDAQDSANTDRNQKLAWPIVMGGDSQHARTFNGGTSFDSSAFQTQLVSGKDGSMAPSAPTGLTVSYDDAGAKLTWGAPARPGSAGSITYEVSKDDGLTWVPVGGANTYTFADAFGGDMFVVRALGGVRTAAEIALVGAAFDVVYSSRGAWARPATP